jgi:hypothetical protein
VILALAIAALELLAVVWACALLWINAGLRREIDQLREIAREKKKPANSDFSGGGKAGH